MPHVFVHWLRFGRCSKLEATSPMTAQQANLLQGQSFAILATAEKDCRYAGCSLG